MDYTVVMIEVRNLQKQFVQKQFGAIAALRDVSFLAPDGAITGLLGANGAGKSTTLRTICGVLSPGGGEVRIDGASLRASVLPHVKVSVRDADQLAGTPDDPLVFQRR